MKFTRCLIASLSAIVASCLPLAAEEPGKPLAETRFVLRISNNFIQGLVGPGFQRDDPIDAHVGKFDLAGKAHTAGKFQIALHESKSESNFEVLFSGDVQTQMAATRRPVVVQAHGAAPFRGRRQFVNKSEMFVAQTVTLDDVRHHFTLDEICSSRRGPTGALTRQIARPFARRGLADGDNHANGEIRIRVTQSLEAELDKLVLALNRIPPLVKKAHELIILENKVSSEEFRSYRAATKEYLLLSIDKPDCRIPSLPNLDKDKQAPLELWIAVAKNAPEEERLKFMLRNWRLIVPFLRDQLQRSSPDLTKELSEQLVRFLDEVQVHEIPGWHVLTFAPKTPRSTVDSR